MKKLERVTFLQLLTVEEKNILLEKGTEISIQKGNTLFLEGEPSTHIYLIKKGRIRLSKTTVDGKMLFFQIKQSNDIIGEFSLYNDLCEICSADVLKDSSLVRFERVVIEDLCRQNGSIALAFIKWFANHNHSMLAQFRDLIFCGKKGALCSVLIRLSNAYGEVTEDGIIINKKLTNQELANYIGATRESISRILKGLIEDKIITQNAKYITIHQLKYLQDQLRCEHCPYEKCTI